MAKKKAPGPKKPPVKKVNPFELKFNKAKHDVLGKKKNAGGLGHPGLSKKRAHEQREKTLGVEHSRVGVVNKIIDRRLGEKDDAKSSEEKASLRFAAERIKNFKKANKYNLNDDDDLNKLTHGGAALTSIQKYERTLGSDDEDDDTGALGAEMVKFAHFGGGASADGQDRPKTRQDVIADLIAKSKQTRHEKQLVKDDQEIATENLDEKYKKLLGKVTASFRPIGATRDEVVEKDDYDKLALQLKIDSDAKATPAERTKSDEERAADEKARLEELEATRLARMNAKENGKRHLPVDVDIDPEAAGRPDRKKKARFELRFDESGQVMNKDKIEKNSIRRVAIDSDASDEEEEANDEDNEEDLDDLINCNEAESGEEDEEMDGEGEEEENEDEEDEDNDEEDESEEAPVKATKTELKAAGHSTIPFVFDFPAGYSALVKLLQSYRGKNVGIVLERLVKCHHPGLKEGNKDLMKKLFLYTLRFYDETSQQPVTLETVEMLGTLCKSLYAIMKFNIEYGVRCVRAFIRQNWKTKSDEKRKKAASFTLISLLRLVASLFPVSDIWHPVCSPALLLATYSLGSGMIVSPTAVARQLLLLTTVTDFIEESRRYVPELIGFVHGALTLAVEDQEKAPTNAFPISEPHSQMLLIRQKVTEEPTALKLTEIFDHLEDDDTNRCRILKILLGCVRRLKLIYAVHEETFTTVFSPIVSLLKKIPSNNLPSTMADDLEALINSTEADCNLRAKLIQLSRIKTEKSMLKMLEPKFETHFDPERPRMKRDGSRKDAAAQNSKMKYLYKKEMRGAIRELRKDTSYLGRKQRSDVAAKDRDRQVKTKRLMADLSSQQGEWNAEKREGGKKKKR